MYSTSQNFVNLSYNENHTGADKDLLKDGAINILGWLDKIETMAFARTENIAECQSSVEEIRCH